ncbi:hypothetical protein HZA41_03250 [Candidatus Peregrinibacteria bacterium]|nr:hypothetical protein [Candidatus Peregrinibacteria bacterium]
MPSTLTDNQLYQKVKFYGKNALLWRQKFIGLLPEVQKRRLYEKKHFGSIFEFAFKLAGLSEQQVRTTLNLEKRFSDKPALKALLENGEVSVNKLVRIQAIATPQNEEELARVVKILPRNALETLVRDENGGSKPKIEIKSLHVQDFGHDGVLQLNEKVTKKLLELQKKGIDVNKVLLELLNRREREIADEKETISANLPTTTSRYVPARIQKVVRQEHGNKCSIPTCHKPAEHLHHTQTFALSNRHDPRYLAPLCKEHHLIAHSINVVVQEKRETAVL